MIGVVYEQVPATAVPANLVWIVPARFGGQIVEVAYSTGMPAGCRQGDGAGMRNYDADHGYRTRRTMCVRHRGQAEECDTDYAWAPDSNGNICR